MIVLRVLLLGLFIAAATTFPDKDASAAEAQGPAAGKRLHAMSLIGEPKYKPDFKHFNYVNPDAPKGGAVRLSTIGSFDSFNVIPLAGSKAAGLGLIYDQLFDTSLDEASTEYALIAEWASYPEDYSSVTFGLREGARWHDGRPITPEDVIFSMEIMKKANPNQAFYYQNVVRGEKTGEREVTFYFDVKNNREMPHIVSQLVVLPKHFWTGKDAEGKARDPLRTTLEIPLGSGPYRLKSFQPGQTVVYERVSDYWAKDLPVRAGQFNFDEIRIEYFLNPTAAFEAFKAGRIDYHAENSAKAWATDYNFPALERGHVVKRGDITLKTPEPMQAFVFNTRRRKFADPRVRRAFNLALNFEWMNENIFYGQYKRTGSYFENTELAAKGLPEGLELAILEDVRGSVPAEVFTQEYKNPVSATETDYRENLRTAFLLLKEAGWTVSDGALKNAQGETMEIEFLIENPTFERVVLPYAQNLERLGMKVSIRVVDAAQYKERTDRFDFDMIWSGFAQSESPGNEQRDFWGSAAADKPGSRNEIGVKDPAIDKLIDRIIFAKNREELVAASRALDRVLLWNHFVVPMWHSPNERIAYWDRYAQPRTLPSRAVAFIQVWWQDPEKAAKLQAVR